jgi:arabinan endo-1,5-alpha-L-arabinosidase
MADSRSLRNPVWSGYCADPHVIRHEGIYYAYGTYAPVKEAPGIENPARAEKKFVLLRSTDLASWEYLGGPLVPVPGVTSDDYWAPEVAFARGKFWMYYSCLVPWRDTMQQRLRVAVADSPVGPFRDCGKLLFPEEGFTIDASPFRDPQTGRWYLYFARDYLEGRPGTGTAVAPLDDDMTSIAGPWTPVAIPSADWQVSGKDRLLYGKIVPAWHTVEGPHVVFHAGRYYCFYSGANFENASYGVAYAVADHPLGPWQDEGTKRGACVLRGEDKVIGPGHNSVVLAPDGKTHLCAYHAWDPHLIARQLCLDPIEWTPDGPEVHPTR